MCATELLVRFSLTSVVQFCALVQLIGLRFLKETYAPVLLRWKALALKKEMGLPQDSDRVQTVFELQEKKTVKHIITHGLQRPFAMFAAERECGLGGTWRCRPPAKSLLATRHHSNTRLLHGPHLWHYLSYYHDDHRQCVALHFTDALRGEC